MNTEHNPEHYEQMNAPYDTAEDANAALDAFFEDMIALRKKHRIGNVVTVACVCVKNDEQPLSMSGHCGSSSYIVPLLISAIQTQRAQFSKPLNRIDSLIDGIRDPKSP